MRKILLATTLLSIAVSENILMENYPRMKTACDKHLCNRKAKRIPRKDISSKLEESLNYDDGKQFPQISDTRFISESRKLSPMAVIRQHDLTRFSQVDLSSDKPKLDSTKPRVLISIDIQERNAGKDLLHENCSTRKKYCKYNQGWQIQPLYVEEPRWIDVDIDHIDSSQRMGNGDPYILTRGKKIFRIKDPEQVDKTIEDYEATLDYPINNNELSIKSRVRRSVKTNEGSPSKTADEKNNQIKERNKYDSLQDMNRDTNNTAIIEIENRSEKSSKIDALSEYEKTKDTNHDVFTENYEKDDPENNLAERPSRGFKFIKQNQISANDIITDFVEQKIQREDISNDIDGSSKTAKIDQVEKFNNNKSHFAINKRNKRSVLLKNTEISKTRKKLHGTYKNFAQSKKDVEKNETYEQIKNKAYDNKLNDLGASDNPLTLYRDKNLFNDEIESSNNKDTDKSIERTWELHYTHRKKLESEGEAKNEEGRFDINKDYTGITDSRLRNEFDSKNSETKTLNYREKRNVCKTCKLVKFQFQQDELLKDIEKEIQESLSLERRDKYSDILKRLTLSEPYIISRGKKASQDFGKDELSSSPQNMDEKRVKILTLPVVESLLRMLLIEISRCNNNNCDITVNQLSNERLSPRDRRGTLDEIFAAYDPYYVARGKRMNRNQKGGISFATDARQ